MKSAVADEAARMGRFTRKSSRRSDPLRLLLARPSRRYKAIGGIVILLGAGLGLLGKGSGGTSIILRTGQAWLANAVNGTVSLIDGYSGATITQVRAANRPGQLSVVNGPDGAVVVDANGHVTKVSNASFRAGLPKVLFSNTTAEVGQHAIYAVDEQTGLVQQLDASSPALTPVGPQIRLGGSVSSAVVDDSGRLWAALPARGTIARVHDGAHRDVGIGAHPGDRLAVTLAATHVVAVDSTTRTVHPIDYGHITTISQPIPETALVVGSDTVPAVSLVSGTSVIGVPVDGTPTVTPLPTGITPLSPVMTGVTVDLLDQDSGRLLVVNTELRTIRQVGTLRAGRANQLVLKDGLVFVNDTGGASAMVLEPSGRLVPVQKFTARSTRKALRTAPGKTPPRNPVQIQTGTPTGSQTQQPTGGAGGGGGSGSSSPRQPSKPGSSQPPAAPGAPPLGDVTPADQKVIVNWQAASPNGSPVIDYSVQWSQNGAPVGQATIAAHKRASYTKAITNLNNGTPYTVSVSARNGVGMGTAATRENVIPTNVVPSTPTLVDASAPSAGQVLVSWTAPNNGYNIGKYEIIATTSSGSSVTIDADETGAGQLRRTITTSDGITIGAPETYTVTAVGLSGAKSPPSDPAGPVTAYGAPSAPTVGPPQSSSDGSSATVNAQCDTTCEQGEAIDRFQWSVTRASDGTTVAQGSATPDSSGSAVLTLAPLSRYSQYAVTVTAHNGAGTGTQQSTSFATGGVPQPVNAYDNYALNPRTGHAMCRGNPNNSLSDPGGTATQTFTVPSGVATLNTVTTQVDTAPVSTTATLRIGGVNEQDTEPATGDVTFHFAPIDVSAGEQGSVTFSFSATAGKIITLYTIPGSLGTFTASNSCPDGAPNYSSSTDQLRATISGYDHQ
ncbi:fibronectin type III domain-containing protein [uncultured Jatrophihabitans sp.]|uniref:fibronectin type III domain-containing protein n=1 Tax=uncultured Jatrophihabitans sp. TaxID=1610747 RepID=UPI0035CC6678